MVEANERQLIFNLAREMVAENAPQELPMFRAQGEAYFRDPEEALKPVAPKDEMLGFGVETAAVFITPAVMALATLVIEFVVQVVQESVQVETKEYIGEVIQGMFERLRRSGKAEGELDEQQMDTGNGEQVSLTPEQLSTLRKLVYDQAIVLKLSESTANTLADSFTGRLAVSTL